MGALLGGLPVGGCAVPRAGFLGPPAVRTQHPVELTVLDLTPRTGRVLPAGEILLRGQSALTNQLLFRRSPTDEPFRFDGEILRLTGLVRVGLGGGFDLEATPGATLAGPGFLDEPVDQFHDFFGLPGGLRNQVEKDGYTMSIDKNGGPIYRLERDQLLANDLPLILSRQFLAQDRRGWEPDLLARIALEVPTGSYGKGTGNGGWDFGAGLAASKEFGLSEFAATVSLVAPHTPGRVERQDGEYQWRLSGSLNAELPLTEELTVLLHLQAHRSVLAEMKAGRLSRNQVLFWAGGRWDLGGGTFAELLLGEGITQKISPDFTLFLCLGTRF